MSEREGEERRIASSERRRDHSYQEGKRERPRGKEVSRKERRGEAASGHLSDREGRHDARREKHQREAPQTSLSLAAIPVQG